MKLSAILLGSFSLFIAAEIADQRIEINVGNTRILDLMRQLDQARKGGNDELALKLAKELSDARSEPIGGHSDVQWATDCKASAYLDAEIYAVSDPSNVPEGLKWAWEFLDKYWTTDDGGDLPYPGDFSTFMHKDGFRVLMVDYEQLPWAVREWREKEMEKGVAMERKFIAVLDGVAFFAPGVVTWLLPLFAGRDIKRGVDACQELDELLNLKRYHNKGNNDPAFKYSFEYAGMSQVGTTIKVKTRSERQIAVNAKNDKAKKEEDKPGHEDDKDEL
ncbi:hypothetical protein B0T10DRAFT_581923 [Thelonectria olida]|uniref:Uncharacterized protein n=1 Tax=Thelonectria olida TaxID=1576542 RepID=A0A9P8VZ53_9HYPO|nr:hypothetical protein B0T10DRAFT_581923 [Thelonectria olida]